MYKYGDTASDSLVKAALSQVETFAKIVSRQQAELDRLRLQAARPVPAPQPPMAKGPTGPRTTAQRKMAQLQFFNRFQLGLAKACR